MLDIHDIHHYNFEKFLEGKSTPLYIFDLNIVMSNFHKFKKLFPKFKFFYSVKTNPMESIIDTLNTGGSCFDAATIGEINILISRKISPSKILFTHPVKTSETIKRAFELGVDKYTFDSLEELQELIVNAPNKKYYLRLLPPIEGNFYEYRDKFGASEEEIEKIFTYTIAQEINVHGLSFHVGSQNMSLEPWKALLELCRRIITKYYNQIPSLRVVNIGSGFPYSYGFFQIPSLSTISNYILQLIKDFPDDIQFWAEPGRIIVADAGVLVCTIIRNIQKKQNRWLFIDTSVYHGLIEILESRGKLTYKIESFKEDLEVNYNISGNTLDPDDTIAIDASLPKDLKSGDKLVLHDVGAYTTSFFTTYHSLPIPVITLTNPIG